MRFKENLAFKNIKTKPARSALLIITVALFAASVYGAILFIDSVATGTVNSTIRLGSDIVVVPEEQKEKSSYEELFLKETPNTFFLDQDVMDKVYRMEGVEVASPQVFLASDPERGCDSFVQIIGYDPVTDFSIRPWIWKKYGDELEDGEVIVGHDVSFNADNTIRLYNITLNVMAQTDSSNSGLDNSVFVNMNTARALLKNAKELGVDELKNVDPDNAVSAVAILRGMVYETPVLAEMIHSSVDGVNTFTLTDMMESIAAGSRKASMVLEIVCLSIRILAFIILISVAIHIAKERKKEFAVLRILGASKRIVSGSLRFEVFMIALIGTAIGVAATTIGYLSFLDAIKIKLEIPMARPQTVVALIAMAFSLVLEILVTQVIWGICVIRVARKDIGLLSKEDE